MKPDPTISRRAPDFPDFVPRWPWRGGDLQTLRNYVLAHRADLAGYAAERLRLELHDSSGDALIGTLNRPRENARPPVVLVHGLTGCEDSAYIRATAAHLLDRGHPVLRLNLRGAGLSRSHCRFQYHAGRSDDLRHALAGLDHGLVDGGVLLVGYSLGANMLLKFLAEEGETGRVLAAASVSAPIDLAAASRRMMAPRNRIYHRYMLRRMKDECLAPGAEVTAGERTAVSAARSVYEFDDVFVGPRNGFAGAEDYYARCSAGRMLADIRVPTLVISAGDDPWIPLAAYEGVDWRANPDLHPLLPEGGGHVGFHGRGHDAEWHDRCIACFFAAAL